MSKNPKNWWKLMKIANVDREIFDNFWTTWGISMNFLGKMWLMMILKVTKKQGFTPSLEDIFFEKNKKKTNYVSSYSYSLVDKENWVRFLSNFIIIMIITIFLIFVIFTFLFKYGRNLNKNIPVRVIVEILGTSWVRQ